VSRAAHGAGRLEALLQEQRSALREGKFEVLSSLAARLEKVTGSEAREISSADAARLRRVASENANLIRAAMAGLADARKLRRGTRDAALSTYDASGRLSSQAPMGQILSRR
jgi:hypothetical protein